MFLSDVETEPWNEDWLGFVASLAERVVITRGSQGATEYNATGVHAIDIVPVGAGLRRLLEGVERSRLLVVTEQLAVSRKQLQNKRRKSEIQIQRRSRSLGSLKHVNRVRRYQGYVFAPQGGALVG